MPKDFCKHCGPGAELGFDFTFAFQPIVDVETRTVYAYEALVRGLDGEGAGSILGQLDADNRYVFDQRARTRAIEIAARLFKDSAGMLSINILPNAVYDPERCLRTTLRAARDHGFPLDRLMFEITEQERVTDIAHLRRIAEHYSTFGFTTAIDDFGAGHSGLGLLAEFTPNVVKLDREIVKGIHENPMRQAIANGMWATCEAMGIELIAEGVETEEEYAFMRRMGVRLFQGFYFARPAFEALPAVNWGPAAPEGEVSAAAKTTAFDDVSDVVPNLESEIATAVAEAVQVAR